MGNIKKGDLEKIYTPDNLTKILCDLLDKYHKEDINHFLEPAAGSGQMVDYLKERYNKPIYAFDIKNETKRNDITELDFLKLDIEPKKGRVTIMNPPFHKGIKFLDKCIENSDFVVTILAANSWINIDYDKIEVLEIILTNQTFSNGKSYPICIVAAKNKKQN